MTTHAESPPPPPEVPGYRIVRLLGVGGFATVWEAVHLRFKRTEAIKVLNGSVTEEQASAYEDECEALGTFGHETGFVQVYGTGETQDGRSYIAMEHCPGGSVRDRLQAAGGPLPVEEVAALGTAVARALETCHLRKVFHRDVKPGNILVNAKGAYALSDFGAVVLGRDTGPAGPTSIVGTPGFIAPELFQAVAPGAGTDQFALGATLYTLAVGHRPPSNEYGVPTPFERLDEGVPRVLGHLIERAMHPEPEKRFGSMGELLAGLAVLCADERQASVTVTYPAPGPRDDPEPASGWQVAPEVKAAVVRVETADGAGSGFLVRGGRFVVTNRHVVDSATDDRVTLLHDDGTTRTPAWIRHVSPLPGPDLAILEVPPGSFTVLGLDLQLVAPAVGHEVAAIGTPLDEGHINQMTFGHVSSTVRVLDGSPVLYHSAELTPGNSGGPCITKDGRVVGVNSARRLQVAGGFMAVPAVAVADAIATADVPDGVLCNGCLRPTLIAGTCTTCRARQALEGDARPAGPAFARFTPRPPVVRTVRDIVSGKDLASIGAPLPGQVRPRHHLPRRWTGEGDPLAAWAEALALVDIGPVLSGMFPLQRADNVGVTLEARTDGVTSEVFAVTARRVGALSFLWSRSSVHRLPASEVARSATLAALNLQTALATAPLMEAWLLTAPDARGESGHRYWTDRVTTMLRYNLEMCRAGGGAGVDDETSLSTPLLAARIGRLDRLVARRIAVDATRAKPDVVAESLYASLSAYSGYVTMMAATHDVAGDRAVARDIKARSDLVATKLNAIRGVLLP